MDLAILFAPLYVGALLGLVVAALAWGRPHARAGWQSWPWLWGAVLAVGVALAAARLGWRVPVSGKTLLNVLGAVLLCGGAWTAVVATRRRRRAELLAEAVPVALHEAVARARRGAAVVGVFRARVGGQEEVTSPGGVVCAFYEAELRERTVARRRGRLIASERAFGDVMWARGEGVEVPVTFGPGSVFAPEQTRRTLVAGRLALSSGRAYAGGDAPTEAVSWEKVGRLGESCLVAGQLRPGPAPGSYLVRGVAGSGATVILGEEPVQVARRLMRASWGLFGAAVALFTAAAWLLTR